MLSRRTFAISALSLLVSGCFRTRRRGPRARRAPGRRRAPVRRRRVARNRYIRRRRVRRRIHRRLMWRTVTGRRVAVVPVGVVVGWQLSMPDRVVVVHEVKTVYVEGKPQERIVVVGDNGYREEIPVVREDTAENRKELEGSELPSTDTTTPALEVEVEEDAASEY